MYNENDINDIAHDYDSDSCMCIDCINVDCDCNECVECIERIIDEAIEAYDDYENNAFDHAYDR